MKKILYFIVIPLFAILALISASAWYALKVVLNENFLVQQIESNLNVRAEVRKLNVSLFSAMSSVELEGVSLGARDSYANQGTVLSERPPMKGSVLTIGKIDLKFSLLPLLRRKFELNRFMLSNPVVSMTLFANGGNSLKPLFQKPLIVGGKPNPALAEKPAETTAKEEEKPFSAKDLPISADLREIGLKDATVNLLMQKTGQLIRVSGLTLVIDSIDIDPADLVKHNNVHLDFDANVNVISVKQTDAASFLIRSAGNVTPFDAKTGEVSTGVEYALVVKKDSFITGMAIFDQLAGELPVLSQVGFSWKKLSEKAVLLRDVNVRVRYSHALVTFLDDTVFPTANYDLLLKKGSTINCATNEHNFNASVRATEAESKEILARFDRGIEKKLKGQSVEDVRNRVLGKLIQNGQVDLPFASLGNFANPSVKLLAELPSLTDVLTGSVKDILKNKLDQKIPGVGKELLNKLPF